MVLNFSAEESNETVNFHYCHITNIIKQEGAPPIEQYHIGSANMFLFLHYVIIRTLLLLVTLQERKIPQILQLFIII